MAKNIAIADDVYELLTRLKRENESFTDVIRRLVKKQAMLHDLAGRQTFTRLQWNEVKEGFRSQEELNAKRKKELLHKVEEQ